MLSFERIAGLIEEYREDASALSEIMAELDRRPAGNDVRILSLRIRRFLRVLQLNRRPPSWQERGLDRSLLDETVKAVDELTVFEVATNDLALLYEYARESQYLSATVILQDMRKRSLTSVKGYLRALMANLHADDLPLEVSRWLWTYAVRTGDLGAAEVLHSKMVTVPRHLLTEIELMTADVGYIYLMLEHGTNPAICKIGFTRKHPDLRERELNASTSQHRRIELLHHWRVREPEHVERQLFQSLAKYRVNADREFFQIPPARAAALIEHFLA
jgi:Meiotically Up-regulated Gene 113 (MUG113) protein